jgi:hypothetical protein
MPAVRTRVEARARIRSLMEAAVEKMIPADETVPLKGSRFRDFETQAETVSNLLHTTLLEERAALEDQAHVPDAGRCPHCGSDRVYLKKEAAQEEALSPHGPVTLTKQQARCRACGGSFSPSGPGLGLAGRSAADPGGGGTAGPGGGPA